MIAIRMNGSIASMMRPPRGGTTFMARVMKRPPFGSERLATTFRWLKLALGGELHEARIEPQLDVCGRTERRGRRLDTDRILRLDVFSKKVVIEAEAAHEVHDLRQLRMAHEIHAVGGLVIHVRGLELGLEAGEIG